MSLSDPSDTTLRHGDEPQAVLGGTSVLTVTMLVDADARLRYVSPRLHDVLGHEPSKQVGRSVFELVHPDDVARASLMFDTSLKDPGIPVSVTVQMHHSDGHCRDIEMTSINLLADRRSRAMVLHCVDVTDRNRSEATLRELEHSFRTLVEQVPAVIYTRGLDSDSPLMFINSQITDVG